MAATRPLTVIDVYERFVKGKKVPENEWDYTIIPQNLTALKEKYKLKFEPGQSVPEDNETKNALFQAGLAMSLPSPRISFLGVFLIPSQISSSVTCMTRPRSWQ